MNNNITTTANTQKTCPICACEETIVNQNHQVHCFLCNGFPCEKCASLPTECTCISTEHENENVSTCCKECGEILPVAN